MTGETRSPAFADPGRPAGSGSSLHPIDPAPAAGFACPSCRGQLGQGPAAYACGSCGRRFPVVLGIPDFRIAPDPWLGIEEDRDKARRLEEVGQVLDFEGLVRFYWSITPGTRADLAERYARHALAGEVRGESYRDRIGVPSPARLLDLGCGAGGLLVAAARRGDRCAGVDVAMRWLVVARRRLREAGVEAVLVCANAEWLPFPDGGFDAVTGLGLLEHALDRDRAAGEARRTLRPGGRALFTVVNRWAPTPEPHLGLWGVGYLPRSLAVAYARRRRGVPYERIRLMGAGALRRLFRHAGFVEVALEADALHPPEAGGPGRRWTPLVRLYERARTGALPARLALSRMAPVLSIRAMRPAGP